MPSQIVFWLEHVHVQDDGEEDMKSLGTYSTRENAEAAIERFRLRPGFSEVPDGFTIRPTPLDVDGWTSGYITIKHPARGEDAE